MNFHFYVEYSFIFFTLHSMYKQRTNMILNKHHVKYFQKKKRHVKYQPNYNKFS